MLLAVVHTEKRKKWSKINFIVLWSRRSNNGQEKNCFTLPDSVRRQTNRAQFGDVDRWSLTLKNIEKQDLWFLVFEVKLFITWRYQPWQANQSMVRSWGGWCQVADGAVVVRATWVTLKSTLSVARIALEVVSGVSSAVGLAAADLHHPNWDLCMASDSCRSDCPLDWPIERRWRLVRPGDSSGDSDRSECHHKDERDMSCLGKR